jgi:hypothetical protein
VNHGYTKMGADQGPCVLLFFKLFFIFFGGGFFFSFLFRRETSVLRIRQCFFRIRIRGLVNPNNGSRLDKYVGFWASRIIPSTYKNSEKAFDFVSFVSLETIFWV